MRLYLRLLLLFSTCCGAVSAQNLLVNGGFEDENICTEFIKNCAPEGWIASSLRANYYFDEVSMAQEGRHFVGLVAGNVNNESIRSFVRTRLICSMRKGNTYHVSFYIRSAHPVLDSIAAYFSPTDFLLDKRRYTDITPQHWSIDGAEGQRTRTIVWQKVSFSHIADGSEVYFSIGSFKRTAQKFVQRAEFNNDYYFFLDNVTIVPADPAEKLCEDAETARTEIYREDERHQVLERRMYQGRKFPPIPPVLTPTVVLPPVPAKPVITIDTLIIPDVLFATASYRLSSKGLLVLDSFAQRIRKMPVDSLAVEGHTDSVGSIAYNQQLSLNRARAVQEQLLKGTGFSVEKFRVKGWAFQHPTASNKTPEGRSRNRRVEIYVYRKEER